MNKKDILNNITIAFSGYNIKDFAVLAIESFLLLNPDMRKNIVYFDDESTDGTREELESRGIKVITWDNETKEEFKKYETELKNIIPNFVTTITRVSAIYNSIIKQTKTKFLYISDGDIFFTKDILSKMINIKINTKSDVVVEVRKYDNAIIFEEDDLILKNRYAEFLKLKKKNKFLIYDSFENGKVKYSINRMRFTQGLIDLEALGKKFEVREDFSVKNNSFFEDTGTSLYEKCITHNIKIYDLSKDEEYGNTNGIIFPYFIHFVWVSSSMKEKRNSDKVLSRLELLQKDEKINKDFLERNVDINKIIENYKNNIKNNL